MKKAIILLGPPGAGKGTQGDLILKNFPYINRYVMSDLLKREAKNNEEINEKIKKGELINDNLTFEIFKKYFKRENIILIDGTPRTLKQTELLTSFLEKEEYKIIVLNLKVDESKLIKRITNRYYCPTCHRSYNLLYNKPKHGLVCDYDGTPLIQREDDKPEIFKKRLKLFDEINGFITNFYDHEIHSIYDINGDLPIPEVAKEIKRVLNKELEDK